MKKTLIALLLVCTLSALLPAFADSKLSTVQKNLMIYDDDNGYFFAKVENTGTSGTYVDYSGDLVGFDEDDNIVFSESYVTSSPASIYLEPGEDVYFVEFIWDSALATSDIADYKFSIKSDSSGHKYKKMDCDTVIDYSGADSFDNYVNVTFTNDTDDTLYDICVVVAMYDADGNIIFVDSDYSSTIGIHPGSTLTFNRYIDYDLVEYYEKNDIVPATAEGFLYVAED